MNSFLLSKALHIVNRTVFEAKGLTENQEQLMFSSADAALNLEPASLEDIVNTHLFDFPVGDELLLSAITTKNNRLKATMAALVREMNSALGGKLQAGEEFYSLIGEKLKGRVISSAIVSKPRKTGQFAVITALIPLSDGQSISIIFYAPDDDPLKINETDTLIAFRFLLNKRDITHIVAPLEGKDLSLKQTCANLAELALKNTDKFTANKEKSNAEAATLLSIQEQTEAALNEANQIAEQADEKSTQIPELNNSIADLNEKLERNTEANRLLEIEINNRRVAEPDNNATYIEQYEGPFNTSDFHSVGWLNRGDGDVNLNLVQNGKQDPIVVPVSLDEFNETKEDKALMMKLAVAKLNEMNNLRAVKDEGAVNATKLMPESNTFVSVMTMPRVKTAIANVKSDGNSDIASSLSTIEKIDNEQMPGMDRSLFVQSITGKVKRMHKNGEQSKVDNALTMINEYNTFSDKPAITNRNAIWKLGEVVNIQEGDSLEGDTEQRIKNSEEVTDQKANFWYGMRVRPFSIGSQPDNNAAYIDQTEALTKFADKNIQESDVRYGAIAYQDRLTDDQVDHYNLTDLSIDANADMELGESSVGDVISDWANANGNDQLRVPQSLADELKNTLSSHYESGGSLNAMQKSGLSDYLRDQEAFKNRKEEPNEYKKWVASINAVPLNILHEYVDMFVSHEEAPKEDVAEDVADEVQASADSQLISKLNPSDFESGSIYNKEKLTDLTEIAKRIRKDIAGLKKSGKIPSETKISVKKSSGRAIDLTLTGFSSDVPMFDTEWLSKRSAGDDLTGRGYSSEMESLIKYVNALVDQYNYDNSEPMTDDFDVNFYGGRLDVEYQLKNEALERESNQLKYPEEESDMNANPELQKHLDVISDITNGKITDHNDALVKLKAAGEYIQANDLVDEYEADISSAADVITALMKAAMSAIN